MYWAGVRLEDRAMWHGMNTGAQKMTTRREKVVTFFRTQVSKELVALGVCQNCIRHSSCHVKAVCVTQDFAQFKPRDVLVIDEAVRLAETLAILAPQ